MSIESLRAELARKQEMLQQLSAVLNELLTTINEIRAEKLSRSSVEVGPIRGQGLENEWMDPEYVEEVARNRSNKGVWSKATDDVKEWIDKASLPTITPHMEEMGVRETAKRWLQLAGDVLTTGSASPTSFLRLRAPVDETDAAMRDNLVKTPARVLRMMVEAAEGGVEGLYDVAKAAAVSGGDPYRTMVALKVFEDPEADQSALEKIADVTPLLEDWKDVWEVRHLFDPRPWYDLAFSDKSDEEIEAEYPEWKQTARILAEDPAMVPLILMGLGEGVQLGSKGVKRYKERREHMKHKPDYEAGKAAEDARGMDFGDRTGEEVEVDTEDTFADNAVHDVVRHINDQREREEEFVGATYNLKTQEHRKTGYSVGVTGKGVVLKEFTPEALQDFIDQNREELNKPDVDIGVWYNSDKNQYEVDLSRNFDNREEAIKAGRTETSIWDHAKGEPIQTGGIGSKKLYHLSKDDNLTELDPAYEGTSYKGARLGRAGALPSSWFYVEGTNVEYPVHQSGKTWYEATGVKPEDVYNIITDIDGIVRDRGDLSVEQAVQAAGYKGFHNGEYVGIFEKTPVRRVGASNRGKAPEGRTLWRAGEPGFVIEPDEKKEKGDILSLEPESVSEKKESVPNRPSEPFRKAIKEAVPEFADEDVDVVLNVLDGIAEQHGLSREQFQERVLKDIKHLDDTPVADTKSDIGEQLDLQLQQSMRDAPARGTSLTWGTKEKNLVNVWGAAEMAVRQRATGKPMSKRAFWKLAEEEYGKGVRSVMPNLYETSTKQLGKMMDKIIKPKFKELIGELRKPGEVLDAIRKGRIGAVWYDLFPKFAELWGDQAQMVIDIGALASPGNSPDLEAKIVYEVMHDLATGGLRDDKVYGKGKTAKNIDAAIREYVKTGVFPEGDRSLKVPDYREASRRIVEVRDAMRPVVDSWIADFLGYKEARGDAHVPTEKWNRDAKGKELSPKRSVSGHFYRFLQHYFSVIADQLDKAPGDVNVDEALEAIRRDFYDENDKLDLDRIQQQAAAWRFIKEQNPWRSNPDEALGILPEKHTSYVKEARDIYIAQRGDVTFPTEGFLKPITLDRVGGDENVTIMRPGEAPNAGSHSSAWEQTLITMAGRLYDIKDDPHGYFKKFDGDFTKVQQAVYKTGLLGTFDPDTGLATVFNDRLKLELKSNPIADFLMDTFQQRQKQEARGEIEFYKSGAAIIKLFKNRADASTILHEVAHLMRRWLTPEQQAIADAFVGAKSGEKWTVDQEEKFARAFERYWYDGVSPTEKLKAVFQRISEMLKQIYDSVVGSELDIEITPEIKGLFDSYVARGEVNADVRTESRTRGPDAKGPDVKEGVQENVRPSRAEEVSKEEKKETGDRVRATGPQPKVARGLNKKWYKRIMTMLGKTNLPEHVVRHWKDVIEMAKEDQLDLTALDIADEVLQNDRILNDEEHAGLTIAAARLMDEHDAIQKDIADFISNGQKSMAYEAQGRAASIRSKLERIAEASRNSRREAARALSIGGMMVDENYDLVSIQNRAAAVKGKRLTIQEEDRFKALVDEHNEVLKKLEEAEANEAKALARAEAAEAEREVKRTVTRRYFKSKERAREGRIDALKKLADRGFRTRETLQQAAVGAEPMSHLDPDEEYLVGQVAIAHIVDGNAMTLDETVKRTLKDLPGLTERDVHRALNARDPNAQKRAQGEVARRKQLIQKEARLLEEIARIEEGGFWEPETRERADYPQRIKQLYAKLKELRKTASREIRDEARLSRIMKSIEQVQTILDDQHAAINEPKKFRAPDTEAIRQAKLELKDLRRRLAVKEELAKIDEMERTGAYAVRWRPKRKVSPELAKAEIDLAHARRRLNAAIESLTPNKTGWGRFSEGANLLRTMKATADMSSVLRQALWLSGGRPVTATKALVKGAKAFASDLSATEIHEAIRNDPAYYLAHRAKLFLAELDGKATKANKSEEMFMSRVANKYMPWVRWSDRMMVSNLNYIRFEAFKEFVKKFPDATDAELTAWADWINVASGRGSYQGQIGRRVAAAADGLASVVFAPRFSWSRIQLPGQVFKAAFRSIKPSEKISRRVALRMLRDQATVAGLGSTALTLAALGGLSVGLDPREADFGKIRIGDTRIDIWGGVQQPVRLMLRIAFGPSDLGEIAGVKLPFRTGQWLTTREVIDVSDATMRFLMYKTAPVVGLGLWVTSGKNVIGQKLSPAEMLGEMFLPLSVTSAYEAWKQEGISNAAVTYAMEFLGAGVGTYPDSKSAVRRACRKLWLEGEYDAARRLRELWNYENPEDRIVDISPPER